MSELTPAELKLLKEKEQKQREKEKARLIEDYKVAFNTEAGKRVLINLISVTVLNSDYIIRLNYPIEQQLLIELGKRAIVSYIIHNLESKPEPEKQTEAISEEVK